MKIFDYDDYRYYREEQEKGGKPYESWKKDIEDISANALRSWEQGYEHYIRIKRQREEVKAERMRKRLDRLRERTRQFNFHIPEKQYEKVFMFSLDRGISMADIYRKGADMYIEANNVKVEDLI